MKHLNNSRNSLLAGTFGFFIIFLIFTFPNVDAQDERVSQLEDILKNDPNNESANLNMLLLSYHMKDHTLAEKYLVKVLGDDPKRTSSCNANGCMGNIPFLFPAKDSQNIEITAQIQVRNESNDLIAIIETDKINYTPHQILNQILADYGIVNIIQNDAGIFEVTNIIQKTEPIINSYFMDRTEFFYDDYTVLFGYNLAITLEPGDYIITEWTIKNRLK